MATTDDITRLVRLVASIRPLLAGHPSRVQGAALANLTAMWLAGHIVRGEPDATDAIRERVLTEQINLIRDLIPVNATIIHGEKQSGHTPNHEGT